MSKKFSAKIIGILTWAIALTTMTKNAGAIPQQTPSPEALSPTTLDEKPMLFIDAGNPMAAGQMLAGHRSHSSHSSHSSHYSSSGGGGYSRSRSSYVPLYSGESDYGSSINSPAPTPQKTVSKATAKEVQPELIKEIQEGLTILGYNIDSADGKLNKNTKKAIAMFQADQGLTIDGKPSQKILVEIQNKIKNH